MRREDPGTEAVLLANPKTIEYQVVRTTLIPGLLKTIQSNKSLPLPLKIFETSDIVYKNDAVERRATNERRICAVYCNKTAGFEVIHGLLDRLMAMLNVARVSVGDVNGYSIVESSGTLLCLSLLKVFIYWVDPTFFPGRCADLHFRGRKIGVFGIIHPEVLDHFEIGYPCSAFEFTIEPFL